MTDKIWARVANSAVIELLTVDAAFVPGTDLPSIWTDDVTGVADIAQGWIRAQDGTFAAPAASLADATIYKASVIRSACAAAITGGFSSAALGTAHWYGSNTTDQANLDSDLLAAATGGPTITADIPCSADAGVTWAPVTHTAAQIAGVAADFRAWRNAQRAKDWTLQAQIAAATTPDAVSAIAWV